MSDKSVLSCRNLGKSYEEGPQTVEVLAGVELERLEAVVSRLVAGAHLSSSGVLGTQHGRSGPVTIVDSSHRKRWS